MAESPGIEPRPVVADPDSLNVLASRWWADRLDDRHADKREIFATEVLLRLPTSRDWRTYCDYDPDTLLLAALHAAGIECSGNLFSARGILPAKTGLERRDGQLWPKEGYARWGEPFPARSPESSDMAESPGLNPRRIVIRDDSLRDLIAGLVDPFAAGIGTFPDEEDDRHRALHAACLRLEGRGLVRRTREIARSSLGPREIDWEAVPG